MENLNFNQESFCIKFPCTYDYNQFKHYPENRRVRKVEKLMREIEKNDLTPYRPILVNEHGYIIDGERRFNACSNLRKPIYFHVTPGLTQKDMISLNIDSETWNVSDFMNYYYELAKKGEDQYRAYMNMKKCVDETVLTANSVLYAIDAVSKPNYGQAKLDFYEGRLRFPDELVPKVELVSNICSQFQSKTTSKLGQKSFVPALVSIINFVDISRLREKIEEAGHIIAPQINAKKYREMIEDVYNFNVRTTSIVELKYANRKTSKIVEKGDFTNELLQIIEENDKPLYVFQVKAIYSEKFNKEIDSKKVSDLLNYLAKAGKVEKTKAAHKRITYHKKRDVNISEFHSY